MALIKCLDCGREVSSNAPACPGCGSPIASAVHAPHLPGERIPYSDQEVAVMLSKKKATNHLLHFFVFFLTCGLWIFVWPIVALSNTLENNKIDKRISEGRKV